MSGKGIATAVIGAMLGLFVLSAGISQRRQSDRVERLLAGFSRERAAYEEQDRRRWEDYLSQANQSRARMDQMAQAMQQLRRREEEVRHGIGVVELRRGQEESRVAQEDVGEVARSIQESLGLSVAPVVRNDGLFFPLPLSRELALSAVGCRANQSELILRREECQNLRDQLSAGEGQRGELEGMVKRAEGALESEKAAREREVAECQSVLKSVAKVARRGFWGKVWGRTKVVLAFAAGAIVGRLAH